LKVVAVSEFRTQYLVECFNLLFVVSLVNGHILPVNIFFKKWQYDRQYTSVERFLSEHFNFKERKDDGK